jgi:hypothetical protein
MIVTKAKKAGVGHQSLGESQEGLVQKAHEKKRFLLRGKRLSKKTKKRNGRLVFPQREMAKFCGPTGGVSASPVSAAPCGRS